MPTIMSTTNLSYVPSCISFDRKLLSRKMPSAVESLEGRIKKALLKLSRRIGPEHEEIIKKIEANIERIKEKEKNGETALRNKTKRPFYSPECHSGRNERVLNGLKFGKSKGFSLSVRYCGSI